MLVEILLAIGIIATYLYWICTKQFDEFKKRGIPFAKPSFPFGSSNAKEALMGKINFMLADRSLAEGEFRDEKVFGYFMMGQPTLVVKDEELAKHILIKDFDHFTDIRSFGYESERKDGQLIKYMFTNMKGNQWKKVRSMMSGVFTSGKLKLMTPHIVKCGQQMEAYLKNIQEEGTEFEARDLSSMFAIDSFASAGFGIEQNTFQDPDNIFRKMAMSLVCAPGYGSSWDQLRMMFIMMAPGLCNLLQIPSLPLKPTMFLSDIIEKTYAERMRTGYKRNDIIDACIDAMNKSEEIEEFKNDKEAILVANAAMLFFAGFDTQGISISMIFHNMMKFPEYQEKVAEEIATALNSHDGVVCYELIENLKYTEMFIKESMRFKSLMEAHERECTKDYKIPNTDFVIPKGRIVHVYFKDIITDEKNFVQPNDFNPENFSPENHTNKFSFMSFGQGPRACPGTRYAFLAMKIFLVFVLSKYRVVPCEKTNKEDMELDPHAIFAIKGGVWAKLEARDN